MKTVDEGCFIVAIIIAFFLAGFMLGVEAGENGERAMWKDKIRTGRMADLVNIVEKEDALEKARTEFINVQGR